MEKSMSDMPGNMVNIGTWRLHNSHGNHFVLPLRNAIFYYVSVLLGCNSGSVNCAYVQGSAHFHLAEATGSLV
jgi:hypothetical protein